MNLMDLKTDLNPNWLGKGLVVLVSVIYWGGGGGRGGIQQRTDPLQGLLPVLHKFVCISFSTQEQLCITEHLHSVVVTMSVSVVV